MRKTGIIVNLTEAEASAMRAGVAGGMDLSDAVRHFAKLGVEREARPAAAPAPVSSHSSQPARTVVVTKTVEVRGEPVREYVPVPAPVPVDDPVPSVDMVYPLTFACLRCAFAPMTCAEIVEAWRTGDLAEAEMRGITSGAFRPSMSAQGKLTRRTRTG